MQEIAKVDMARNLRCSQRWRCKSLSSGLGLRVVVYHNNAFVLTQRVWRQDEPRVAFVALKGTQVGAEFRGVRTPGTAAVKELALLQVFTSQEGRVQSVRVCGVDLRVLLYFHGRPENQPGALKSSVTCRLKVIL